ncbi:hypothetical protein Acr_23g0009820 [Actinidia rufa]|uniref:Uncharacterized protein n=1 Tax=Actinidia rufa TaxID=165716 RepID=A0A7J0GP51_9ERIC|nr:hypothetical protein Acr_23g0009820 [Actinidia rufa]
MGLSINLSKKISSLTYGIVARTAFGKKNKDQEEFISLVEEGMALAGGFSIVDLYPSAKVLEVITGMRSRLEKLQKRLDKILESIVNEHRDGKRATEGGKSREAEDLVDVLLRIQKHGDLEFALTDDNIKAVILKFGGEQPTVKVVLLAWYLILGDLRKRTNVTGRGEAATNSSGKEIKSMRAKWTKWRRESRMKRSRRNFWVAKYGRRSHGCRKRIKRMAYGGGTAKVGVREKMETHIDLIHKDLARQFSSPIGEAVNISRTTIIDQDSLYVEIGDRGGEDQCIIKGQTQTSQLETILDVVPMVPMKLIVLVFISPEGVGLDFSWPLHKFLILDLHEYLGYMGVKRRQYKVGSMRWHTGTSVVSPSPSFSVRPLAFHLVPIIRLSSIGLLSLVIIPSSPPLLGFDQLFYNNILAGLALELRQGFGKVLGEGVKQRAWAMSFYYGHNHHFITGVLYLPNSLIEPFDVVFQAISFFLVTVKKSLIFWVVDLSQPLGAQSSRQGDLPLLLVFLPFVSGVQLEDRDFERIGLLSRLECKLGATIGGGLFMARCCIKWAFFSFTILICLTILCIARCKPSSSGAWLVFAIGCALLSKRAVDIWSRQWRRESRVRRSRQNSRVAKYERRSLGCRRRIRRMPYGGGTVKVGVREKMETHIDLIHKDLARRFSSPIGEAVVQGGQTIRGD